MVAFHPEKKIDSVVPFGDFRRSLVEIDGNWCKLVTQMRHKSKRFSVSLSEEDYKKLRRIANGHRPPFSLQYVVTWAIQEVLDRGEDPQLLLELGNPLRKRR